MQVSYGFGSIAFGIGGVLSLVAFPTQAVPGTVAPGILDALALVVLFNLASIAFFTQYNLTREDHERNTAILAQRRVAERSSADQERLTTEPDTIVQ